MAHKSAIESAGASGVGKAGVFRRLGRPIALAAAALAAALLMAQSASAQLYTTTGSTGSWNSTRWASGTAGPFTQNWASGSDAQFTTGTYTFSSMFASPTTGTIGNVTTATNVNISFGDSASQTMTFNNTTKTFSLGAGSVVDFGSVSLAGTNGLIKSGAGTLALTGSAYTGGFTLNAGNVIARGDYALGSGSATIYGGAIGAVGNYAAVTRTGGPIKVYGDFQLGIANSPASDSANMTFGTPGNGFDLTGSARTITLGSSGTMTFGKAVTNGSLTLNRLSSGSAGQFSLANAGSLTNPLSSLTLDSVQVNASGTSVNLGTGNVTLKGADATRLNINANWTVANTFTIENSAGTKTITAGSDATINGKITNNDSTGGFTIGAGNGLTLTIGAIGGTGTTGVRFGSSELPGTVVMTGSSNYAGDTRIDSSTLKMSGAGYVSSGGNLVFRGSGTATFDLNGTTQTVAGLDDSLLAGSIRSSAANGKLIVGGSSNSTFQGTIASGANVSLEKAGSGTLTLSGSNSYTGGTTLTAGTLALGSANAIGASGTISFGGGTLQSSASNTTDYSARFSNAASQQYKVDTNGQNVTLASNLTSSGGSFTKLGTGAVTLSGSNTYSGGTTVSAGSLVGTTASLQGAITNNAAVTFDQSTSGTYSGAMAGSGALTKLGAGAVTLSGSNTYSGGTTVSAGSLVGTTASLQGAITNNAAVTFDQATGGTYSGAMSGSGLVTKLGTGAVTLSGANTYSGGTTVSEGSLVGTTSSLQGAITNNAAVTFNQSTDGTYSGAMAGSGALAKLGTGALTLSGSNTYTGGTTLTAGTLGVGNASALGSGNLAVNGGTLDLKGNSITVATLSGSSGGIITSSTTGAVTLTGSSASDATYGGAIQNGTGTVAFVKRGAGTLTLSGTSTYSGATTVSAGTLLVNGSLTNSAVTVGNGGTLGGSGTLGALVTVLSGGTLSPGNSPGALAAAELDLQAGSTTFMQVVGSGSAAGVAGTGYDQMRITTASRLTYGGELVLSFIDSPLFDNGTLFSLFYFTGTAGGGFTSVRTASGSSSYSGMAFQYNANGNWYTPDNLNGQYLVFSPASGQLAIVPEPSTWVMAAIGAGLVALKARRRKRAAAAVTAAGAV